MHFELPPEIEKYRDQLEPLARYAAALEVLPGDPGVKASKFGGAPFTPAGFLWPLSTRMKTRLFRPAIEATRPMSFLAQISFAEVTSNCPVLFENNWGFPNTGLLQFFYDVEEMPWGLYEKDKNFWKVIWYPDIESLEHVPVPQLESLPKAACRMDFKAIVTFPTDADDLVGMGEAEGESFRERGPNRRVAHQLGGWPEEVQGTLFYNTPSDQGVLLGRDEANRLAQQWRLVLQIDSDEELLDYMWGDAGMIYLGVRESDLAQSKFSNTWLELQCY
jgi:uncharacterized protein YwqG